MIRVRSHKRHYRNKVVNVDSYNRKNPKITRKNNKFITTQKYKPKKYIDYVKFGNDNKAIKIDTIYNKLYAEATNKKEFSELFSGYKTSVDKSERLAEIYHQFYYK